MAKAWEALFPNLNGEYIESSNATLTYNCVAFAAGDVETWWDPLPEASYYWPPGVDRNYAVGTYIEVFKTVGYARCVDGSLEPGCEKIAIYVNNMGSFEHVARQLSDGRWTSKLAEDEDIIHDTLGHLIGDHYGRPVIFMARPR